MSAPQDLQVNNLSISSTSDVFNFSTGALSVAGGASITKGLWVNGSLQVRSPSDFYSDLTIFGNRTVLVSTVDSTSVSTGTLVTNGGVGVAKSLSIGGNLFLIGKSYLTGDNTITGNSVILSTRQSTLPTTGALVVSGGVGISGNINILGALKSSSGHFSDTVSVNGDLVLAGTFNHTGDYKVSGDVCFCGATTMANVTMKLLTVGGFIANNTDILQISTPETKFTQTTTGSYHNSISLFTYGSSFSDRNFEALQIASNDNSYTITSRSLGFGTQRNLSLQNGTSILTLSSTATIITGDLSISGNTNLQSLACSKVSFSPLSSIFVDPQTKQTVFNSEAGYMWNGMSLDTSGTLVVSKISCGEITLGTDIKSTRFLFDGNETGLCFRDKVLAFEGDQWFIGKGVLGVASRTFAIGFTDIQGSQQISLLLDNSQRVTIPSTFESTSPDTGAMIVLGGVGIGKSLSVAGDLTVTGTLYAKVADSTSSKLLDTTDSTSLGSGAVVVSGGMSIQKNVFVGGDANLKTVSIGDAHLGVIGGILSISHPTQVVFQSPVVSATTLKANKLVVDEIDCPNFNWDTTPLQTFPSGINVGSVGTFNDLSVLGKTNIGSLKCNSIESTTLLISNTTTSTSPLTGCLVLGGGLGVRDGVQISRNLQVFGNASVNGDFMTHGNAYFHALLDSADYTNGAVALYGGMGIGMTLNVGGDINSNKNVNVQGSLFVKGHQVTASDIRFKYDIRPLVDTLEKVKKVLPRKFKMKETSKDDIGFIAQNLEEVFPELVHENKDGFKYVDYPKMTAVLLAALQELTIRVETLEKRV